MYSDLKLRKSFIRVTHILTPSSIILSGLTKEKDMLFGHKDRKLMKFSLKITASCFEMRFFISLAFELFLVSAWSKSDRPRRLNQTEQNILVRTSTMPQKICLYI